MKFVILLLALGLGLTKNVYAAFSDDDDDLKNTFKIAATANFPIEQSRSTAANFRDGIELLLRARYSCSSVSLEYKKKKYIGVSADLKATCPTITNIEFKELKSSGLKFSVTSQDGLRNTFNITNLSQGYSKIQILRQISDAQIPYKGFDTIMSFVPNLQSTRVLAHNRNSSSQIVSDAVAATIGASSGQ